MLQNTVLLLIIGLVAGFVAAVLLGQWRRYGVLGYLIIGVIGAIGGNYAFGALELPNVGPLPRLIAALAGSIVLVLILRLVRR